MKFKILMLLVEPQDATAFYRSAGIAENLKLHLKCDVHIKKIGQYKIKWDKIGQYDLVMYQRPQTKDAIDDAHRLKEMGIPIWLDYDDDMLNVHPQHVYAAFYNIHKELFKEFLKLADLVTVSTQSIKNSFVELNSNIHVVNNGIHAEMMERRHEQTDAILWRGSITHLPDVFVYGREIQRLINEGNRIKFMGMNPFFLHRCTLVLERDLRSYFEWLKIERPRIIFVPLIDHKFNIGKSNIAWIEATMAGAVCVAQDLPEWEKPGVVRFNNPTNFYNVMKKTIKNYDLREFHGQSFDYIMENLTVDKLNKKRVQAIETVLK